MFDIDKLKKNDPHEIDKLITELTPAVVVMSYKLARGRPDLREDLVQEGLIALPGTAKNYNGEKGASFNTFALVCARNRMIDALRKMKRRDGRQADLYGGGSLPDGDGRDGNGAENGRSRNGAGDRRGVDEIGTKLPNETDIVDAIMRRDILKHLPDILSGIELKAFFLKMRGASYKEIAEGLSIGEKAVDNALARAKKKIFALYNAG